MKFILVCLALAALALPALAQECEKKHPFSVGGASGKLSEKKHGVSGTVKVIDDCTFEVDFTYDGEGAPPFWYGAKTLEGVGEGIEMQIIDKKYTGEKVKFKLINGATWDSAPVLSVWCKEFALDFGSVVLSVT